MPSARAASHKALPSAAAACFAQRRLVARPPHRIAQPPSSVIRLGGGAPAPARGAMRTAPSSSPASA